MFILWLGGNITFMIYCEWKETQGLRLKIWSQDSEAVKTWLSCVSKMFLEILQESCRLHTLLGGGDVFTSAQLPLPGSPRSSQTSDVPIGRQVRVCTLIRCGEVYGFITWLCADWVLRFPLLRNVPSPNLRLPTATVLCLLQSLSECLRAPPACPLGAACVDGSVETVFVLWRGQVFESRWAGGGVGDSFGTRR